MSERRFKDPVRDVVAETKHAGCDRLTLKCGHEIVVDHRSAPRKQARCHHQGCRLWLGTVVSRTVGDLK